MQQKDTRCGNCSHREKFMWMRRAVAEETAENAWYAFMPERRNRCRLRESGYLRRR